MVHDSVWKAAGMNSGFPCISCLERRLGRQLRPRDFKANVPINYPDPWDTPQLAIRKMTQTKVRQLPKQAIEVSKLKKGKRLEVGGKASFDGLPPVYRA